MNRFTLLFVAIAADTILTLSNWHLEKNPVVLSLGKEIFILHHIVAFIAVYIVYHHFIDSFNGWQTKVANYSINLLIGFYMLVGIANLTVYV